MTLGQLGRSQAANAATSSAVEPCGDAVDVGRAELDRLRARVREEVIPGLEALARPDAAPAELVKLADHQSRRLRAELEPDAGDALFGRSIADDPACAAAREWVRQHLHDTALQVLEYVAGNALGMGLDASQIANATSIFVNDLREWVAGPATPAEKELATELERVIERDRSLGSLGSHVQLETAEANPRLPSEEVEAIAGAVFEAVTNARKHAEAENVYVRVVMNGEGQVDAVTVTDDGIGIDLEQAQNSTGLGVKGSIVGRMKRVGGEASIEGAPGKGTVVRLVTPKQGG